MKVIYNYYIKVTSEEHMLYGTEIAKLYGINSESYKEHASFVKAFIQDYTDKNLENYIPVYYIYNDRYRNGAIEAEVYPALVYESAMEELYKILKETNIVYTIEVKNKKYKVIRVEV